MQTTLPIYHHADWAAELSYLGSSTSFQAHSSDFVTGQDNRYQRDVFGMPSNAFTFISHYFRQGRSQGGHTGHGPLPVSLEGAPLPGAKARA